MTPPLAARFRLHARTICRVNLRPARGAARGSGGRRRRGEVAGELLMRGPGHAVTEVREGGEQTPGLLRAPPARACSQGDEQFPHPLLNSVPYRPELRGRQVL